MKNKCVFKYAGQSQDGTPVFSKAGSRVAYITTYGGKYYTRLLTLRGEVVGLGLALGAIDLLKQFNLSEYLYKENGEEL
jgi:hypothetical protein